MRSVCFFASYFAGNEMPYYITVYLKELKKHFSDVVLFSSQKELSEESNKFLSTENVQLCIEENEGFDFGMWYKAFKKFNVLAYDKIALVNDSCILFKPLDNFMDWSNSNQAGFKGMTISTAVSPHLQSYFLLLDKEAVTQAKIYFEQHGVLKNISDVIKVYEIGLSTFLLSKNIKMAAYVDNNGYNGEYSPYYHCISYHLFKGIPLIKKKILFASYRKDEQFTLARMNFNIDPFFYVNEIKKYNNNLLIDFDKLKSDITAKMSVLQQARYFINVRLIRFIRIFRK